MKKIIALIMSIFVIFTFTGCGGPSAEEAAKEYMNIIFCKDEEEIFAKYLKGEEIDSEYEEMFGDELEGIDQDGMDDCLISMFKNIDYEILSVEEDGDSAKFTIKCYTIDFEKAYENAVIDTVDWAKTKSNFTAEQATNKIMENLTKEINKAGEKDKPNEKNVTFLMSKEDNMWYITNAKTATEDIFSDMTEGINKENNNLESYFY